MTPPRQQQIATGPACKHHKRRKVESYGGATLAEFCASCGVKRWELGDCSGCGEVAVQCTKFVRKNSRWFRFHDGVCQGDWLEAEKAKRAAIVAGRKAVAK